MKWFKHFTKAHEDRAVEKLIIEFGVKGYGLYFYCLEIIAGTLDADNITFELEPDAQVLAHRLSMDSIEVEKIMHRCIELNLLGLADSGRINCLKLGKYLEKSITSNPEIRKIITNQKQSITSEIIPDSLDQIRLDKTRQDKIRINNKPSHSLEFDRFWKEYPKRVQKQDAIKAFKSCLKNKENIEDIIKATINYRNHCQEKNTEEQYVKHPATFLRNERWKDWLNVITDKPSSEEVDKLFQRITGGTK